MNDEELRAAASALGKKGGAGLVEKYGTEHMAKIGRISGKKRTKSQMREMAQKSVEARKLKRLQREAEDKQNLKSEGE